MLPEAYISHSSKGRLRLRIPSKKHDSDYFSAICRTLEAFEFIENLEINLATASVLVHHIADLATILGLAKEHRLFAVPTEFTSEKEIQVDPNRRLIKSLIGLGVVQILRGEVLAPASTLFMDAYRLHLNAKGQSPGVTPETATTSP